MNFLTHFGFEFEIRILSLKGETHFSCKFDSIPNEEGRRDGRDQLGVLGDATCPHLPSQGRKCRSACRKALYTVQC